VTDELPRTKTGKLARSALKKLVNDDLMQENEDLEYISNPEAVQNLIG
jgi:acyl-coenzyme A synthetase/AMP-(fatty) acid ligase